jgi:hypothetical protein
MLKDLNLVNNELCNIATNCGTDKYRHGYTKIYYELMKDKKDKEISLFEIGIYMGSSLKMWSQFFTKGLICGIDNGRILHGSNINAKNMYGYTPLHLGSFI